MSTHNKKENQPKLSQICNYGICSKGPKNTFETAVLNEPSVLQPLKFYCIWWQLKTTRPVYTQDSSPDSALPIT